MAVVIAAFDVMLPERPPTVNHRLHHMARARQVKAIRECAYYSGVNKAPKATGPRQVALCLHHGKGDRTLDAHDNLPSALKAVVDGALVDTGLIVDDSPQWVTVRYHQDRAKDGRRRCAVTVWE